MKKKMFFTTAALSAFMNFTASAQPDFIAQAPDLITNSVTNNVGIGTTAGLPVPDKLTINGDLGFQENQSGYQNMIGRSPYNGLNIYGNYSFGGGSGITMNSWTNGGDMRFIATPGLNAETNDFSFLHYNGSSYATSMQIRKDGKVGIGTTQALDNDLLTVAGDISYMAGDWNKLLRGRTMGKLAFFANTGWSDGGGIMMNGKEDGDGGGSIAIVAGDPNSSGAGGNIGMVRWDGGAWTTSMEINKNGKVSIGTPQALGNDILTVAGDISYIEGDWNKHLRGRTMQSMALFANTNWDDGAGMMLNGNGASTGAGDITFVAGDGGGSGGAIGFSRWNGGAWTTNMRINPDGQVTIGDVSVPNTNYKLFVEKGILTEKVKVALKTTSDWSDFVFANDYKLRPLADVADYISQNEHLPDFPSAEEVVSTGIDMAKMDAKLLQKIEELTLYLIEQQKEINDLKKSMNK